MTVDTIVMTFDIPDSLLAVRGPVTAGTVTSAHAATADVSAARGGGSVQSVRVAARVAHTSAPGRQQ